MEYVRVCLYEVCVCMFLCIQVTTRTAKLYIPIYLYVLIICYLSICTYIVYK